MSRATAGRFAVVAVVVASLGVTAAGVAKSKPPQNRSLTADKNGELKFNKTKFTVKAGKVRLVMTNPKSSGQQHGIAVKGNGLDKDGKIVNPGKTSTVTVTLKKGKTYTFYCPVPGHAAAGMKGKITVK
jgi:uncharacterized cupredoxin-like copper-binding protein